MSARLPGSLVVAALCACSTPLAQLKKDLGGRASAELGCAEKKLEYKETERIISTTRVVVSGCGKSVKYKLVESRWSLDESRDDRPSPFTP